MTEPFEIHELDGSDEQLDAFVDIFRTHDVMMHDLTAAGMRRWHKMTGERLELLARRGDEVVGAAGIYAQPYDLASPTKPMQLALDPRAAGLGIRRALVDRLWAWARERHDAPRCTVGVDERSKGELAFWAELGFLEINRYTELELLLAAAAPAAPDPSLAVITLEQRPELARPAWELVCATWNDMPGEDSEPSTFEDWIGRYEDDLRPRAGTFLAVRDEDERVEGIVVTGHDHEHPGDAYTSYTGVLSEARGRGIATALKLHQVRWCRDAGYRRITTGNHLGNAPMLAINERLGFEVSKTVLQLRAEVPSGD